MRIPFSRAFSLVELLVVMAIIVLLLTLAGPSLSTVLTGSNLARSGQTVGDYLTLAHQEAIAKNRDVYLRLYKTPALVGGQPSWNALQIFRVDSDGVTTATNPVTRVIRLADNTIVAEGTLSPLLSRMDSVSDLKYGPKDAAEGRQLHFRANGEVSGPAVTSDYLTVLNARDESNSDPSNYYTVQINSITGKVTTYRPNL